LPHSVYRGAGWESWAATGKKATHSRESSGGHHAQTPLRLYVILHATLGVRVAMGCGTFGPLGNPTTGWRWRCADPLGTCGPLGNFMGCGTFCPLGNPTTGWRWRCAERTVFCLLGGADGGTGDSFPLVSAELAEAAEVAAAGLFLRLWWLWAWACLLWRLAHRSKMQLQKLSTRQS
jgi:hypothetical protein